MATHPLIEHPEVSRVDYLTVVARACAADGVYAPSERVRFTRLCTALDIDDSTQSEILRAAVLFPEPVRAFQATLCDSPLRYAALADCLLITQSDGLVVAEEKSELMALASLARITRDEFAALVTYVRFLLRREPDPSVLEAAGIAPTSIGAGVMLSWAESGTRR